MAASPIAEQVSSQLRVSTKKAFPDHLVSLLAYSIDNNMTSSAKCISSVEQDFKSQCEKMSCDLSNFGCIDRLLKESEALAME
ncbi:unnamed protein product [Dibothriocephalus latus]|uniref:Uncharacterized protein n=1 Tax=Dibothriocephalus latus TaxID=60516 RepID=A0A3P7M872_DIBLA|nr:unnamed protein product [Dibothriocephalus latus]